MEWHVTHEYSLEMALKSEIVSDQINIHVLIDMNKTTFTINMGLGDTFFPSEYIAAKLAKNIRP